MNEAIYLAGGVILGAGITYALLKNRYDQAQNVQDHLKAAGEQLISMAKEKLGAEKEVIRTDLEGKKDAIKTLVDEIRLQLKEADRNLRKSDEDRVSNFSDLKVEIEKHKQLATDLRGTTEELKNVLSNNQLRGQFGERVVEDLLRLAGFVINSDYVLNKVQDTASTRPDVTLILPDKCKVHIDVKFPYQSLLKYAKAENEEDKKRHLAQFQRDVRDKIKQIASRDYINPDENTVDFAVAFIPNEMIFSFIYEHLNDVWEEAMGKKVVLAGPYSFIALLRLVKQAHSNFRMQSNIHNVIQLVQKFRQEYDKYSEEFEKVGDRIEAASKQYQVVSSTRNRQLTRIVDQIDNQQVLDTAVEPKKLLED
jgi:DNA recombination protein RmuC